jgi:hypothetical protein
MGIKLLVWSMDIIECILLNTLLNGEVVNLEFDARKI